MGYGFKLYKTQLRRENGRKDAPFQIVDDQNTWRFVDYLSGVWASKLSLVVRGLPHASDVVDSDDDDAPRDVDRSEPLFGVEATRRVGAAVLGHFRYGRHVGHDQAMPDPETGNAATIDIRQHTPSHLHRAVLIAPSNEDATSSILAVEAIGRPCPVQHVIRWSKHWARSAAIPPDDGSASPAWFRMQATQMGDDAQLAAFLASAEAESLVLQASDVGKSRLRGGADIKMELDYKAKKAPRQVREAAEQWGAQMRRGEPLSAPESALGMATLLGMDVEGLEFSDADIVMRGQSGEIRHIGPDRLSEMFTYWIDDALRPTDTTFLAHVRGAVHPLEQAAGLSCDWDGWPAGRT